MNGGWEDSPEDEREGLDVFNDLGKYDAYEGWPEETAGAEYWLYKRAAESGEV